MERYKSVFKENVLKEHGWSEKPNKPFVEDSLWLKPLCKELLFRETKYYYEAICNFKNQNEAFLTFQEAGFEPTMIGEISYDNKTTYVLLSIRK